MPRLELYPFCYRITPHAEAMRMFEPAPQINPHLQPPPAIDDVECFLTTLFLSRYVTYCARRCRYAQMQRAAQLLRELAVAASRSRYITIEAS